MHFWDEHKTITRYYEMKMAGVCEKYDLRQMEYDILMFLYNNPKYNTAADIVSKLVGMTDKEFTDLEV